MNEKIFIAIPSANDPQLFETISRAIDNAEKPEGLTICFSTQYSKGLFEEYFGVSVKDARKLINTKGAKIIHLNMKDSFKSGVCVTRNKLASLLTDEKYFFSIDSHTSFGKNWDKSLKYEYNFLKENFAKPILTGYIGNSINMSHQDPDRNNFAKLNNRESCGLFNSEYVTGLSSLYYLQMTLDFVNFQFKINNVKRSSLTRRKISLSDNHFFTVIQHLTAHNFFVDSNWVKEVNWPPYIKFYGEEPDLSLRSFLCDYDMITSNRKYISDFGMVSSKKDKDFVNYDINHGSQELAKLVFTGKNNYYDFSNAKRKPIDWLAENFTINYNFDAEIVTDEFDWVEEF